MKTSDDRGEDLGDLSVEDNTIMLKPQVEVRMKVQILQASGSAARRTAEPSRSDIEEALRSHPEIRYDNIHRQSTTRDQISSKASKYGRLSRFHRRRNTSHCASRTITHTIRSNHVQTLPYDYVLVEYRIGCRPLEVVGNARIYPSSKEWSLKSSTMNTTACCSPPDTFSPKRPRTASIALRYCMQCH